MNLKSRLFAAVITTMPMSCTDPMTVVPSDAQPSDAQPPDAQPPDAQPTDAPTSDEAGFEDSGPTRPDSGSTGAITVVGGLGPRVLQSVGEITVIGGFEPQGSCVDAICLLGGFARR